MEKYLGHLTAENREEREKFLPNAFVVTEAIKRALGRDVCFVCGRRGAGKTAVASMLGILPDNKGNRLYETVLNIVEEDFLELHTTFYNELLQATSANKPSFSDIENCYYHFWRFLLDLLVLKAALQLRDLPAEMSADTSRIESYFDAHEMMREKPADYVTGVAKSVWRQVRDEVMPLTGFSLHFKGLRSGREHGLATKAASDIFSKRNAAITIDTMETYDLSNQRVHPFRGLCKAVKEFQNSGDFRGVSVKCMLPAEMTDKLFRDNLAKYNEFAEYLIWNYADLLEFLAKRFLLFLRQRNETQLAKTLEAAITAERPAGKSRNDFWREAFWKQFFPETVLNSLGWPEDACGYLLRHTQKRPREILSCMNYVLDHGFRRSEFPKMSAAALNEGIHDPFNIHQLLSDNLSIFNLPRTEKTMAELTSEMLADETTVFSGSQLGRFCKRALGLLSTEDDIWDKMEYAQEIMLRSGLIGRVRPNTKDEPAHIWPDPATKQTCKFYVTEFEYLIPGHIAISESSLCGVHPILGDRLGLRPPKEDSGIVYPLPEKDDFIAQLRHIQ